MEEHQYDTPNSEELELIYAATEDLSTEKKNQSQTFAIEELISTEETYLSSLELCTGGIYEHLSEKQLPNLDLDGLYGNIKDVIEVSRNFLTKLKTARTQKADQLLLISNAFLDLKQDMENVYKEYCANYENTLMLEKGYQQDKDLWQEIRDTLKTVACESNANNLSFFLVKPVQRISKYPLLLNMILKNTLVSDKFYTNLKEALMAMEEVNLNINEYKRLKEVANKYNKVENLTLREKVGRISKHSCAKKAARLSLYIQHEAGIVPKTEDKEFELLKENFFILEKAVTQLQESITAYWKCLQTFLSFKPYEFNLGITEECAVTYYQGIATTLYQVIFPIFIGRFISLVYKPLCTLSELFIGPQQLIKKHSDKLLDYEQIEKKMSMSGDVTYEEKAAVKTYKAINHLLVSELPQFNQTVSQFLVQIVQGFIVIQKDLAQSVLHTMSFSMSFLIFQLPHCQLPLFTFWQVIEEILEESNKQLSSFRETFETAMPTPVIQPLSPFGKTKLQSLVEKHGPNKIFQVTCNIIGSKDLDLTLQKGEFVAVLQNTDIKGNKQRWLVDAGGNRGYVPAQKIQQYHLLENKDPVSNTLLVPYDNLEKRRHSYSITEKPLPHQNPPVPFYQVFAGYAFTARSSHEVSLQPGQPVTIVEPYDKKGNLEWNLVEVNGQRGYVPSNFLVRKLFPWAAGESTES
uniref:Rho guanine nucleotide exchange factor 37 n=1 Tax=Latimeria chalumnae TaxID=7897 RepID=H3AMS2_LATCH